MDHMGLPSSLKKIKLNLENLDYGFEYIHEIMNDISHLKQLSTLSLSFKYFLDWIRPTQQVYTPVLRYEKGYLSFLKKLKLNM